MKFLYVVSEDDNDASFFAMCADLVTGHRYEVIAIRSRKRRGYNAVQTLLEGNLRRAAGEANAGSDVSFLVGIDNDRSPHPENAGMDRSKLIDEEKNRQSRLEWVSKVIKDVLGVDRDAWPLPVAIAVPVEMLESWLVRALRDLELQPSRHFSRSDSLRARQFYHPLAPPPQWKDLAELEQSNARILGKQEFYLHALTACSLESWAARSVSFRMFKEWLDRWPKADFP
jgi:hypothetical protein